MATKNSSVTQLKVQDFIKSSAYLVSSSAISTIINTLIGLLLVRILTPSKYGEVAVFLRVFGLIRFIGTLGLGAKVIQDISHGVSTKNVGLLGNAIYSLGLIRVTVSLILLLVTLLLTQFLGSQAYMWAGISSLIASLMDFSNAIAQGLKKRRLVSWLIMIQPLIYLASIVIITPSTQVTPVQIYVSFTVSLLITLVLYWWTLTRSQLPSFKPSYIKISYLKLASRALVGLFGYGVLNYLHQSIGTLVFGWAEFFESAAYLNAVLTPILMPGILGLNVASAVFYPELVTLLAKDDLPLAGDFLNVFLKSVTAFSVIPAAVLMVFAHPVIYTLYTSSYAIAVQPLTIASPLLAILMLQQFIAFAFHAMNKTHLLSKIMLLQLVIALAGSVIALFLGEDYQIIVAAIFYLLSGVIGIALQWAALKRLLPFHLSIASLLSSLITSIAVIAATKWLFGQLPLQINELVEAGIVLALTVPFCAILVVSLLFKLTPKELLNSVQFLLAANSKDISSSTNTPGIS